MNRNERLRGGMMMVEIIIDTIAFELESGLTIAVHLLLHSYTVDLILPAIL